MPCSETEPVIEDVREFFPEAVKAEKKGSSWINVKTRIVRALEV
jgi:hypothetical protein